MKLFTINASLDKTHLFEKEFKAYGTSPAEEKRRAFDLALDYAYFVLRAAPYGMNDKMANLTLENVEFDVVDVTSK